MSDEKARRDAAMSDYLAKPQLKSSQAPGQPRKFYNQPPPAAAPAVPQPALRPGPEPRVVERTVYVGPTYGTILGAILSAWLIISFVTAVGWFGLVQPELEREADCLAENIDRSINGLPEQPC